MWLILFRVLVVAGLACAGYMYSPFAEPPWGAVLGASAAIAVFAFELRIRSVPAHYVAGSLVGGVTGLVGARLVWGTLEGLHLRGGEHFLHLAVLVFLVYMGSVIGGRNGQWFEPARIVAAFRETSQTYRYKILDTSVIIDGRIADICETGFLDGTLIVPQFVLRELQQVADSSDSLKRNRGRRGLDILQKIQKMVHVEVQIVETDFPEVRDVDMKLIELARKMGGKIVTNDFNLNKVAQLRGVAVLNINELANSLKPVVLPGEILRVFIIKEGKEVGQGVGYLDDGTMVVVDQGRRAMGRTIEVVVTSVLQTTAGKMIFCRPADPSALSEEAPRSEPSGRGEGRREIRPISAGREGRHQNGRSDHPRPDRREVGERAVAASGGGALPEPEDHEGPEGRGAE